MIWISCIDIVSGDGVIDNGDKVDFRGESYDVGLLKIWNQGISFQPLAAIVLDLGIDSVSRMTGVSKITIQGITGQDSCRKIVPKLETVARICMGLGCAPGDVVTFLGYEVLGRYKIPEPREPLRGEVSYAPLRGLMYDEYGRDWKKGLDRLLSFMEPRTAPKHGEKGRFKIENEESYKSNWRTRLRHKLIKDKNINLVELYDLCRVLNCQIDNVIEVR